MNETKTSDDKNMFRLERHEAPFHKTGSAGERFYPLDGKIRMTTSNIPYFYRKMSLGRNDRSTNYIRNRNFQKSDDGDLFISEPTEAIGDNAFLQGHADISQQGCGYILPRKKNSRALQAEETKQRIFSAAHHLFREKGFDNVTVDEIAKACGFSVGAFYHHFRGKREIMALWHERLDECYKRHYEKMKNAPDFSQKETVEVIREMMLYINETCIKEGLDFTRVLYCYIISNEDFGNEMMSLDRAYFRILRELTERGLGRKEIRKDLSPEQLVRDLTILSRGCLVNYCIEGGGKAMRDYFAPLLDCYLRGIAKTEETPPR